MNGCRLITACVLTLALPTATRIANATTFDSGELELTIGAHAEAFYSYVLANPRNKVNNARIFDTRHNTFALSSAGLSLDADTELVYVRLALWFGLTSEEIYGAETDSVLWRTLQEAFVRGKIPLGYDDRDLFLDAGLFVSPIGLENVLAKDNWNYSSSNLNWALPFYHTGVRLTYPVQRSWSLTFGVYNGWTAVIDRNDSKSLALSATGKLGRMDWGSTYWLGNERDAGSPEGKPWLSHFDAWAKVRFLSWLWIGAQADVGFEPNRIATNVWGGGALYARFSIGGAPIYNTFRVDYFADAPGEADDGTRASPLFYSVDWVSSFTSTLELAPSANFSMRLEYRHDEAGGPLYFDEDPDVPTKQRQDVLTLALIAWI